MRRNELYHHHTTKEANRLLASSWANYNLFWCGAEKVYLVHYYPHNIADFNNSTRHLTRVEQSVYRASIEMYYDTESMLALDVEKLNRKLLCVTNDEKNALLVILDEFFIKKDEGYYHERCELEIAKYRANTSAKARAGIESARIRKLKSTEKNTRSTRVEHTVSVCSTNQELITNNNLKALVQKFAHKNKNWRSDDNSIVALARELKIGTQGLDKFQLLAKIDAKVGR
jgi:uncharacterized protein YdaU (DUF1376 family)